MVKDRHYLLQSIDLGVCIICQYDLRSLLWTSLIEGIGWEEAFVEIESQG